eukprot:TRINITY_DN2230_c4_g1_i1.p1 TRINITY_DN2230_c4_g1~~TRINITY_DN2230_c4_g1_i1.p1  ORF type:complete len:319 (-),score=39.68 TRINITY_DN2230_c4_g1_i1:98-1054(-)
MDEKCLIMWMNITFNEGFTIDCVTVKLLTLVSRYCANALKNHIEQNYWFDLSNGRSTMHYSPINQKEVNDANEIAPSTKKIKFHGLFNDEVSGLPNTITSIEFGDYYNSPFKSLPSDLTFLKFGYYFNQIVSQSNLPSKLTHLYFANDFYQTIPSLPNSLTHLSFGTNFSIPLPPLPNKLISLEFFNEFNQPIPPNFFPNSITFLSFSYRFNQPISIKNLPFNLTHLKLKSMFQQFIPSLPPHVKQVTFHKPYNFPVDQLSKDILFQIRVYNTFFGEKLPLQTIHPQSRHTLFFYTRKQKVPFTSFVCNYMHVSINFL